MTHSKTTASDIYAWSEILSNSYPLLIRANDIKEAEEVAYKDLSEKECLTDGCYLGKNTFFFNVILKSR